MHHDKRAALEAVLGGLVADPDLCEPPSTFGAANSDRLYRLEDLLAKNGFVLASKTVSPAREQVPAGWDTPVEDFEVTVRTANLLRSSGLRTAGDIAQLTDADLLAVLGNYRRSLNETKEVLSYLGLRLSMAAPA